MGDLNVVCSQVFLSFLFVPENTSLTHTFLFEAFTHLTTHNDGGPKR